MRIRFIALAMLAVLGLAACSTPTADKAALAKTVGDTLTAQIGSPQTPQVNCPNPLKLKAEEQTICELVNPSDSQTYEVTVTYKGQNDQDAPIYDIRVASSPKKS
ncbi:DUF4333 domain-containing protein [Stomatohabitans albus]|uniref:DUF4333 domain-containing protein n=1 Tax=Stomatohabitans albus TaxID=3110766 RepID=UPI00300D238B